MSARDEVLGRIRRASKDIVEEDPIKDVPIEWAYRQPTPLEDVVETFVENIEEYGAQIVRVTSDETAAQVTGALQSLGAASVVLPEGIAEPWVAAIEDAGLRVVRDDPPISNDALDGVDAVVTAARVASAETGTICLDHAADQGRRALTLVPDIHVCVVRQAQVVSDVPEAIGRLKESVAKRRPITWISGGSATSDIELDRVEGVHGPRRLFVILEADG